MYSEIYSIYLVLVVPCGVGEGSYMDDGIILLVKDSLRWMEMVCVGVGWRVLAILNYLSCLLYVIFKLRFVATFP